jgi:hypothetical protein
MTTPGILERDLRGDVISLADPEYPKIAALIAEAQHFIAEMNTGYRDPAAMRELFSRLTGVTVDESLWLMQPFYTDFGKNAVVSRDVPDNVVVGGIPARVIKSLQQERA